MKNNAPECVLLSPDEYVSLMDEVNETSESQTMIYPTLMR
jgi:PHD/YefM family antitoxin component YafN of YafNO toxin-antitoxin module